ncbi:hypothetical protein [Aquimonas sp.]|uniref:hypothetical protein n=1 Tax=Aquimonas sp. TaxID=1872588 RepID=UPI0037BE2CA8
MGGLSPREGAARRLRPGLLLAFGMVCVVPLQAADRVAPSDVELLLFLAEFADAEGEVPELGLLEQAAEDVQNAQQMNATPADDADPTAATAQPAIGRNEQAPRPINTDRPRLRGRAEHQND